jgi:cytochrome bd ubiquinol oxidase subunit I
MSTLLGARAQMGTSLAFHIILAAIGVGMPVLFCLSEWLALRTGDQDWMTITRRWSKAFGIVFAVGAVSGTILSFELGLLWPTFMQFSGSIIGLPFALEGFAFFLEAIFLGLYIYGWERLSPRVHWLCSLPLVISGAASAWFVVSANSWMNTPAGFVYKNGKLIGVDPIAAMLNPSTPYETTHMLIAAYEVTGFGVAAICAWGIVRGRKETWLRKGLLLAMSVGIAAAPLQIISGDFNARFIAERQPAKFAAVEALYNTQAGAPITIGGIPIDKDGRTILGIEIPKGLSILAYGNPNATVKGLNDFPADQRPQAAMVHPFFDIMVASGFLALIAAAIFWFLWWRGRALEETPSAETDKPQSRLQRLFTRQGPHAVPENIWMMRGLMVAGPLMALAMECGWIVTEEGRQPWVIQGYLLTKNAATTAPGVDIAFLVFTAIYIALGVITITLLRRMDLPKVMDAQAHPPTGKGVAA